MADKNEMERENFRRLLPGKADFHVEVDDHILGRMNCWLPEKYRERYASLTAEEKSALENEIFKIFCATLGAIGSCLDGSGPLKDLQHLYHLQESVWNNIMEHRR